MFQSISGEHLQRDHYARAGNNGSPKGIVNLLSSGLVWDLFLERYQRVDCLYLKKIDRRASTASGVLSGEYFGLRALLPITFQ